MRSIIEVENIFDDWESTFSGDKVSWCGCKLYVGMGCCSAGTGRYAGLDVACLTCCSAVRSGSYICSKSARILPIMFRLMFRLMFRSILFWSVMFRLMFWFILFWLIMFWLSFPARSRFFCPYFLCFFFYPSHFMRRIFAFWSSNVDIDNVDVDVVCWVVLVGWIGVGIERRIEVEYWIDIDIRNLRSRCGRADLRSSRGRSSR